jgi:hypothetical protein
MSPAIVALLGLALLPGAVAAGPPIRLHPENPHYFLFRGRPRVLVGSTEHYGAVLNLDFDYVRYLDELHARGLNLTRTFSGVYCEDQRSFGIHGNPLAPATGRLIAPWARSETPGCADGRSRFDLSRWDEAYFARCKDFVAQAGKRGIVVELVLFCPFYEDSLWTLSPMNVANNVNRIGGVSRTEVYTTRHADLVALHETLVRKIVGELAGFDNVYFEICNEPYFGGVTREWQYRIAVAIADAERGAPYRHLIAQNIANGSQRIERPAPGVSIFNFHYATPPDAVTANFGLNKAIADDETGFRGDADFTYRAEGWDFFLAGGGAYDNLDYSFTPAQPGGTAVPRAPGGGGRTLRVQLAILKSFLEGFDFVKMTPDPSVVRGPLPGKITARAIVWMGRQYVVYVRGPGLSTLTLDLPAGQYQVRWLNTKTGRTESERVMNHPGSLATLPVPSYEEDIALGIHRM